MAERISTLGIMAEENPVGSQNISSLGIMVEHHVHESLHTSLLGVMAEFYDEQYAGHLKFSSLGVMAEYRNTYSASSISENSFLNIDHVISNFLEEVIMIAGDEKEFDYQICDVDGMTYNLTYADVYFILFEYGKPYDPIFTIKAEVIDPLKGTVAVPLSSDKTALLSGKYIQQLKLIDANRKTHIVSQGKITIFPGT